MSMFPRYVLASVLMVGECLSFLPASAAAIRLPADQPQQIGNVEAVCTGIGLEAREDARWQSYPLKVEMAGRDGQYLGETSLTLWRDGLVFAEVECEGPWLLFKVPAGRYQVEGVTEGVNAHAAILVPQTGQSRVILRFPALGGQSSAPTLQKPE